MSVQYVDYVEKMLRKNMTMQYVDYVEKMLRKIEAVVINGYLVTNRLSRIY